MKKFFAAAVISTVALTLSAAPNLLIRVRNVGDENNKVSITSASTGRITKAVSTKGKSKGTEQRVSHIPLTGEQTTVTASVTTSSAIAKNNTRVYIQGGADHNKKTKVKTYYWATVSSVKVNGIEFLKKPFTTGSGLPLVIRVKKADKFDLNVTFRKATADEQAAAEKIIAAKAAKRAAKKATKKAAPKAK